MKFGKAKLDDRLARESHQLWEQRIDIMCTPMEVLSCGAQIVTTTKRMQFQLIYMKTAPPGAKAWSGAEQHLAKDQVDQEIHQVPMIKLQLVDKLFQHLEQQLLHWVRQSVSSSSGLKPEQWNWYGSRTAKEPNWLMSSSLKPKLHLNPLLFGWGVHTAEPHSCELRTWAPIR